MILAALFGDRVMMMGRFCFSEALDLARPLGDARKTKLRY